MANPIYHPKERNAKSVFLKTEPLGKNSEMDNVGECSEQKSKLSEKDYPLQLRLELKYFWKIFYCYIVSFRLDYI